MRLVVQKLDMMIKWIYYATLFVVKLFINMDICMIPLLVQIGGFFK